MDQHVLRLMQPQRFEPKPDQFLPGRTTGTGRQYWQPRDGVVEYGSVFWSDHDLNADDARMPGECRNRMREHHPPCQRQILFGSFAAKTAATARRDDKRVDGLHSGKLIEALRLCHCRCFMSQTLVYVAAQQEKA